ncbi:hypothetical protein [Actinomadura harenae]|uniref:hypothetical protein n=1 Tax=Actinomadura harenae TaxID=2483351 RepID=UPI0011C43F9A|nr:hypothetical protein [Actinomadura harenae]
MVEQRGEQRLEIRPRTRQNVPGDGDDLPALAAQPAAAPVVVGAGAAARVMALAVVLEPDAPLLVAEVDVEPFAVRAGNGDLCARTREARLDHQDAGPALSW